MEGPVSGETSRLIMWERALEHRVYLEGMIGERLDPDHLPSRTA